MKIRVIKADITGMEVDAIVNAANSSLLGGGGVDGAIHRRGGSAILDACIKIREKQGGCKTGEAVITTAGNLPSKFVIHTVGPVWNDGSNNEISLLHNCYINSLLLAKQFHVQSIAFPNISTGIYRFPKEKALAVAMNAVMEFLSTVKDHSLEEIFFVCFDEENQQLYAAFPNPVTTLYRPVNKAELDLIETSSWKAFPPRLPEQPIFYPVTNLAYAEQITKEWNLPAYGKGYVVEFDLPSAFLSTYNIENVGGEIHNEYWIPAEKLNEMNNNIIGHIRLIRTYE
jgi:O-acetyl-ADP-ribose deacetylase (regulator of RNase III)